MVFLSARFFKKYRNKVELCGSSGELLYLTQKGKNNAGEVTALANPVTEVCLIRIIAYCKLCFPRGI